MISSNLSFISSKYQKVENGRERNPYFEDRMIKIIRPEDKSIMRISINPSMGEMSARLEETQSIFAPDIIHRQDVKTADVLKYIGDDANCVFYVRNNTHIIIDPFSITAKYKSMAELSFAEDQDLMVVVERQDADLMIKYYKRDDEIVDNKHDILPKQDKDINAEKWQISNKIRKPILINKQEVKRVPKQQTTQRQQPRQQSTDSLKRTEYKTYYKDLLVVRITTESSSLVHFEYNGNKISEQYKDCTRPILAIRNVFLCKRVDKKYEYIAYDYHSHTLTSIIGPCYWASAFSTINLEQNGYLRKCFGEERGIITTTELKSARKDLNISTASSQTLYAFVEDCILLVDKNFKQLTIYKCPLFSDAEQVKVKEEESNGIGGFAINVIVAIGVFLFFLCIWKGGATVFQALAILVLELVVGGIWAILLKENLANEKKRNERERRKKKEMERKLSRSIKINTSEAKVIHTNHIGGDK